MSGPAGGRSAASAALGFGQLAIGQASLRLAGAVLGVAAARLLGAEELGRYATALALAGVLGLASGPGAGTFGLREMSADPEATRRLVPDLGALRVLLASALVPLAPALAALMGAPPAGILAAAVAALGLPLHVLVATLDSALLARGRAGLVSAAAVARSVAFLALGGGVLALGRGALALLWATNLSLLVRTAVGWRALRALQPGPWERPSPARWPALARRGLAFGVEGSADVVGLQAPTVLLALLAPVHTVGQFAAAFGLVTAALPIAQGVGHSLTPLLGGVEGRRGLPALTGRALRLALGLGSLAALAGVLVAGPLVGLLFGGAYVEAVPALRALACAAPLMLAWEVLRSAALSLGLERSAARAALVSAGLAVATTLALVPSLGALAPALAFGAMRACGLLLLALALRQALPRSEARAALGLAP